MNDKSSQPAPRSFPLRMLRTLAWGLACIAALACAIWAIDQLTPRPTTWLVARLLDQSVAQTSAALAKHRPEQVRVERDVVYRQTPTALAMDIYRPTARRAGLPPTVVWIHGGGWVAGSKESEGHYAHVLAGRGFNVVTLEYTPANRKPYPAQLADINQALAFIVQHGDRLQLDRRRIFLAGRESGAQLAAQAALLATSPSYARQLNMQPGLQAGQLSGTALLGGPLDFSKFRFEGVQGIALRSVLWSFLGERDFAHSLGWEQASVVRHVTAQFPPTLITAAQGDPLLSQSQSLHARLQELAVPTTALLLPHDSEPALPHTYQLDLDKTEGRQTLEALVGFLQAHSPTTDLASDAVRPRTGKRKTATQ